METQRQMTQEVWIPLMDYAIKKGISVSTLRRHIKARKVTYKIEEGRYLLLDQGNTEVTPSHINSGLNPSGLKPDYSNEVEVLQTRLQRVTQDLTRAQEEIAELKTLIALYEEKIPQHRFNN
jgi:hypothetical protein